MMPKDNEFPLFEAGLSFIPIVFGLVAYYLLDAYSAFIMVIMSPLIFIMPIWLAFRLWRFGSVVSRILAVLNLVCVVFMALPYEYKDLIL